MKRQVLKIRHQRMLQQTSLLVIFFRSMKWTRISETHLAQLNHQHLYQRGLAQRRQVQNIPNWLGLCRWHLVNRLPSFPQFQVQILQRASLQVLQGKFMCVILECCLLVRFLCVALLLPYLTATECQFLGYLELAFADVQNRDYGSSLRVWRAYGFPF